MTGFDHQPRTRIVFGPGSVDRVGEIALELGAKNPLIITDPGVRAAGHADLVIDSLTKAGLTAVVFDQVHENPTTRDVEASLQAARAGVIDFFIGVGGGSCLDAAKGCNLLLTNGGSIRDYWGVGKAKLPMLPMIAIPTTAGTGSECQSAALIADAMTHQKMACLDFKAAPKVAILDPCLTTTQPRQVTAYTGIDAIAHAVEAAVTRKRNGMSLMYAREAFRMLLPGLPRILHRPDDLHARGRVLLGASLAGLAIESSMLGAAHATANPLTAHYGIVHGLAVGLMLPAVVRFNGGDLYTLQLYAELASAAEIAHPRDGLELAHDALLARLDSLLNAAGYPRSLAECGVDRSMIPTLAQEAGKQWTASHNPRALTFTDFVDLYESAFEKRGDGDPGPI